MILKRSDIRNCATTTGLVLNGFLDTKGEKVKEDGGGEINLKSMTDRNAVRAEASMVTSKIFPNGGLCH